jgi:hypothetical protein
LPKYCTITGMLQKVLSLYAAGAAIIGALTWYYGGLLGHAILAGAAIYLLVLVTTYSGIASGYVIKNYDAVDSELDSWSKTRLAP